MLNTNKEYSLSFTYRHDDVHLLRQQVKNCDFIFHLAGENRPLDETLYETNNFQYTDHICSALIEAGRPIPIFYSSSVQANSGTAYGLSKLKAEKRLLELSNSLANSIAIARLPGVFGKWCRPNYNSVVATFCHNISNGLPVDIRDPSKILDLLYVDDLLGVMIAWLQAPGKGYRFVDFDETHKLTVGELYEHIARFQKERWS